MREVVTEMDGLLSGRLEDLESQTQWTWYKLPRWVFRGRKMTPAEKVTFQAVLDFWSAIGCPLEWFPLPLTTLIKWAGMSKPAILRARPGLVKKCFLDFRSAPRKLAARYHLASEYRIPTDTIERLIKLQKTPSLKNKYFLVGGQESVRDISTPRASHESLLATEKLGSDATQPRVS